MKKLFCFIFLSPFMAFSQNVGIGIINPTIAKLEVQGVAGTGATVAAFGTESTGISLQRNWPTIGFNQYRDLVIPGIEGKYMANGYAAIQYFDPGGGAMAFDMFGNGTANTFTPIATRALTLFSSGNVSIHTGNAANASLYVTRGSNSDGAAIFGGTQYNSHFYYSANEDTYIRAGKNNGNVYINDVPGGKVFMGSGNSRIGINTNSPAYTFEMRQALADGGFYENGLLLVSPSRSYDNWEFRLSRSAGEDKSFLYFSFNASSRVQIDPDNGDYNSISDGRLKTNILGLSPVLDKIMHLRPVQYEMINASSHSKNIGFIAQEVKTLFPELVQVACAPQGNALTYNDLHMMKYAGFGVLAVKAIQEQQQIIDELKKEKNKQANQIEALAKRFAEVEKILSAQNHKSL